MNAELSVEQVRAQQARDLAAAQGAGDHRRAALIAFRIAGFEDAVADHAALAERDQQLIALRLASPHRAPAGRVVEDQHNTDALPLFTAAQEPALL